MLGPGRFTKRTMKPRWLLRYLGEEGVDIKAVAKVLNLHPSHLVDARGSMHLDNYLRMFEWAADEFKRPHLGLELAAKYHQEDYGILIFLASNAVELRYSVNTGHADSTRQDVEFTLGSMVYGAKFATAMPVDPIKTCFCHKPTEPLADYHHLFGNKVEFEQAHNGIWIGYDTWIGANQSANPALLKILIAQANQLLSELEETGNFLGHINFLIGSNLGSEASSIEDLAEHLNVTSRTLQRRIEEHGTSFRKLRLEHMMAAAPLSAFKV